MTTVKDEARFAFDASLPIEFARTPPAWWYLNKERGQAEGDVILNGNWQVVAHADEVAEPESFVSGCVGKEPWVVLRDEEGSLRAFANVCRHNGTVIAQGAGTAKELVCPYHGWSYRLDGSLSSAPRLGGIRGFNREEYSLTPLPLREFGPLIMLNIRGNAPALGLEELSSRLEASGWEKMIRKERREYDLECNWKVFVDNYLDGGYHVPFLHPALADSLSLDGYTTEIFDHYSIQSVSPSEGANRRLAADAIYGWVYPNLMINRYGPMMDINVVVPTGPTSCRVIFDWYFEEGCEDDFIRESIVSSERVQDEDIEVCRWLQEGMGSMHFVPGPYAPTVEMGKYDFHKLLWNDMNQAEV